MIQLMELSLYTIIPLIYIFLSVVLYFFPNLLHKRKQYKYRPFNELAQSKNIFCIGHRGGSFQGTQNTIQIFKKTQKICHMFELDICITKDGKLVVHHDPNLHRTCGIDKDINELNYSQLPTFCDLYQPYGVIGEIKTQNNKIPLLQNLFQEFPQKPMNIDLKTPTDQAIDQFDRLIKKYKREHITIWGTINDQRNKLMHQRNPLALSFYNTSEIQKIFLLSLTGLLPFVKIRQAFVQIPLVTEQLKIMTRKSSTSTLSAYITIAKYVLLNLASLYFIPHLKKRGILTLFWIVNENKDYKKAVSMGCAGIMSDRPSQLSEYLKNYNLMYEDNSKNN